MVLCLGNPISKAFRARGDIAKDVARRAWAYPLRELPYMRASSTQFAGDGFTQGAHGCVVRSGPRSPRSALTTASTPETGAL